MGKFFLGIRFEFTMIDEVHPMNYIAGISEVSPEILTAMVRRWKDYDEDGRVALLKMLSWGTLPVEQALASIHEIGRYIDHTKDATELEKAHVILGMESHDSHSYTQMGWFSSVERGSYLASAVRSVSLQHHLNELLSQAQPNRPMHYGELPFEYQDDLNWYRNNDEPLFEGPSFHRLQAAAMCMVLENRKVPPAFFEALDDFSSTGFSAGFILAQLHLCGGDKQRARTLLQSLLDFFGDALPDSDDTRSFMENFQREIYDDVMSTGNVVPLRLPWGQARSAKYWDSVLSLKEVWS